MLGALDSEGLGELDLNPTIAESLSHKSGTERLLWLERVCLPEDWLGVSKGSSYTILHYKIGIHILCVLCILHTS